ncbi:MAG: hypothetical protein U9Q15_04220 [Patescibacteria group bacterium]|nr:hypothetical protein [Patescibacteria group bacterium]
MHIWIVCALPVEQKHIEAQLQKIKKKYYQQQVIPKVVSVGV